MSAAIPRAAPKRISRRRLSPGLTIFYFGQGKGKTTAAVGLAVRARGWGQRVYFLQFVKEEGWPSGERAMLQKLGVTVAVSGRGFIRLPGDKKPIAEHKRAAQAAYRRALKAVRSFRYQAVILDEVVSAVESRVLSESAVVRLIRAKRPGIHLILTGHKPYPGIVAQCDLVTEMRKIKHPFDQGRLAARGIDY